MHGAAGPGKTGWRRIARLLLVLIVCAAHAGGLRGAFLYDDHRRIVENEALQDAWPPWRLIGESERPVADLTFALNKVLSGSNPAGYHAVNLAIHVLSVLLLYGLVRRTLVLPRGGSLPGSTASRVAWIAAAAWGVHPLTTSAVTYLSQRYELLMGLFLLWGLYAFARAEARERGRFAWRATAVLACLLGMASKEVMIVAPLIIGLYDWVFISGASVARMFGRGRWRLYAAFAVTWLLLGIVAASRVSEGRFYAWQALTPLEYLGTQFGVLLHYLRLAVIPTGLCMDYAWPPTVSVGRMVLAGLPWVAIGIVTAAGLWRGRRYAFPAAAFLAVLAPTSSVVPRPDVIMEHRMYLPLACLVVMVVTAVNAYLRRRWGGDQKGAAIRLRTGVLLSGLFLVVWTALTWDRNLDYASAVTMWQDAVRKQPTNQRAHLHLTAAYLSEGRFADAIVAASELVGILPDMRHVEAQGVPARARGRDAARMYRDVRHYAHAHNLLGVALGRSGQPLAAQLHFEEALRVFPHFEDARRNLQVARRQAAPRREGGGS